MAENRKSVSFTDGAVIFDENGSQSTQNHQEKVTAESHSAKFDQTESPTENTEPATDFGDLRKKKKKKSKSTEGLEDGADEQADDDVGSEMKEKKKKKKKSKSTDEAEADDNDNENDNDDDDALLKELKKKKKEKKDKKKDKKDKKADGSADGADDGLTTEEREAQLGDMILGTGIWTHDNTVPIAYSHLLARFFTSIHEANPGFASGSDKNYKIPPPECRREGNKKTIFANISNISARVKRTMEHVMSFLFTELGTSGSVDGAQRLVIKGRYQQKQLENVLIRYINEYVLCKTCKSVDTELEKGENRLHFVRCNKCGSRRSVAAIKSGFSAQIGRRKRTAA